MNQNQNQYVFDDKKFLVRLLFKWLDNPTSVKIHKTLYLLYAYYGATYGQLHYQSANQQDHADNYKNYPPYLFDAKFIPLQYGFVESDIFEIQKQDAYQEYRKYHKDSLRESTIDEFFNNTERKERKNIKAFIQNIVKQSNEMDDYAIVKLTKDDVWELVYGLFDEPTPIANDLIIDEYIRLYEEFENSKENNESTRVK